MSYNVYRVISVGMPRNHHAIFAETNDDKTGWLYQVTGNIQSGMMYEDRYSERPEDSTTFQNKDYIGKVSVVNYSRMKDVCESVPPPKKQFHGPKRLYPDETIRRCQEWTEEAVTALRYEGVLED